MKLNISLTKGLRALISFKDLLIVATILGCSATFAMIVTEPTGKSCYAKNDKGECIPGQEYKLTDTNKTSSYCSTADGRKTLYSAARPCP